MVQAIGLCPADPSGVHLWINKHDQDVEGSLESRASVDAAVFAWPCSADVAWRHLGAYTDAWACEA